MTHWATGHRQMGQYAGSGVAIGAGLGLVIGVLVGGWGIALGMCLGAGLGLVVGAAMDARTTGRPG